MRVSRVCAEIIVLFYYYSPISPHWLLQLVIVVGCNPIAFFSYLFNRRKKNICLISKLSAVITVWKPTITFFMRNQRVENGETELRTEERRGRNKIAKWIPLNDVLMMSTTLNANKKTTHYIKICTLQIFCYNAYFLRELTRRVKKITLSRKKRVAFVISSSFAQT